MLSVESIKPLDALFTTVDGSHLPSSSSYAPPVICLSQTAGIRSSPKWTVALGVAQTSGKSTWYETSYTLDQIERLVKVPGSNLTGQTTIKLLAKSWNTQGLLIKELTKAGSATVEVTITRSLKITINLAKVSTPTIDHLRILRATIPLALSSSHLSSANATLTLRADRADKELAREVTKRQEAEARLLRVAPTATQSQPSLKRSASSQSSTGRASYSQSPGLYAGQGRQGTGSPKKPKLKSGDSGYAGSSYRIGRMADDPEGGFDEDPPSD